MIDISLIHYPIYDQSAITELLFYPRKNEEIAVSANPPESFTIPVEENIFIGGCLHEYGRDATNILFFHGNGEIVSDYDDLGQFYNAMQINFLPVDYRGYGKSNGTPSVTYMMRDCHIIFDYVRNLLHNREHTGPLIIMGRSLGSAPALELASHYMDHFDGLIIESGFAYSLPLLQLVGIDVENLGISEDAGFQNVAQIRLFKKPTLIIHAEHDHIIPFAQGQMLYEACLAEDKRLLKIMGANHNDIFTRGLHLYMENIKWLSQSVRNLSSKQA